MTTDRPAQTEEIEIKVTPEMIEAAAELLLSFNNERDDPYEIARLILQLK